MLHKLHKNSFWYFRGFFLSEKEPEQSEILSWTASQVSAMAQTLLYNRALAQALRTRDLLYC